MASAHESFDNRFRDSEKGRKDTDYEKTVLSVIGAAVTIGGVFIAFKKSEIAQATNQVIHSVVSHHDTPPVPDSHTSQFTDHKGPSTFAERSFNADLSTLPSDCSAFDHITVTSAAADPSHVHYFDVQNASCAELQADVQASGAPQWEVALVPKLYGLGVEHNFNNALGFSIGKIEGHYEMDGETASDKNWWNMRAWDGSMPIHHTNCCGDFVNFEAKYGDPALATLHSYEAGINAAAGITAHATGGNDTVAAIVPIMTPPGDHNNTNGYEWNVVATIRRDFHQ